MNKKKLIFIIIFILIIIAIIFTISRIVIDNNTHRLEEIYEKLSSSSSYCFQMEQENNKNKTIMAKKDDKSIIDQYSADSHIATLEKDNCSYLILYDREEYYVYGSSNIEQNILIDGIKEIVDKPYTKGKEKIMGKQYKYEEYNGSSTFMISSTLDLNEEDIKTRFYFDSKGNLVYIKTLHGDQQELLKVSLTTEVDDSLFEIPSNFAESY